MSSLFFGFLGIVWIIAGIVSFGWPFVLTGIGMIAAAFGMARVSRKADRGDYGSPVPLSPKHYVPPAARLVSGIVVSVFGIVWMIAVFRMGGGWFALFGLMFVFAGIVQAWGFFRRQEGIEMKQIRRGKDFLRRSGIMGISMGVFFFGISVGFSAAVGGVIPMIMGLIFACFCVGSGIHSLRQAARGESPSLYEITDDAEKTDMRQEGVKFCPYCGTKAEEGYLYCSNCGKKLP